MTKIKKLTDIENTDGYIQSKFIKGYKYIDRAGEILNLYEKDDGAISYSMSPERLVIHEPTKGIKELKISNHDFWIHFQKPASLEMVEKQYLDNAKKILAVTGVKKVINIGWRNQYLYEQPNKELTLKHLAPTLPEEVSAISFSTEVGSISVNVSAQLLKDNETEKKSALLLDFDFYLVADFEISELSEAIRQLKSAIRSKEVLVIINQFLEAN